MDIGRCMTSLFGINATRLKTKKKKWRGKKKTNNKKVTNFNLNTFSQTGGSYE
jgi:hypothetical protein